MGYGQEFLATIRGAWGTLDYRDVMNAVEAAVRSGRIDPERFGNAGGSHGGYMVNGALAQSDRFRAGVAMGSISKLHSFLGTSDFGFTDLATYPGPPWRVPEVYLERSPISFAEQIRAPLLLIHSENDLRTPLEQAEQLFTALQVLGWDVELLLYPDEPNGMSRTGHPWHRVHRLEAMVDWFAEHLGLTE